jgi:hypothetical protein
VLDVPGHPVGDHGFRRLGDEQPDEQLALRLADGNAQQLGGQLGVGPDLVPGSGDGLAGLVDPLAPAAPVGEAERCAGPVALQLGGAYPLSERVIARQPGICS